MTPSAPSVVFGHWAPRKYGQSYKKFGVDLLLIATQVGVGVSLAFASSLNDRRQLQVRDKFLNNRYLDLLCHFCTIDSMSQPEVMVRAITQFFRTDVVNSLAVSAKDCDVWFLFLATSGQSASNNRISKASSAIPLLFKGSGVCRVNE